MKLWTLAWTASSTHIVHKLKQFEKVQAENRNQKYTTCKLKLGILMLLLNRWQQKRGKSQQVWDQTLSLYLEEPLMTDDMMA